MNESAQRREAAGRAPRREGAAGATPGHDDPAMAGVEPDEYGRPLGEDPRVSRPDDDASAFHASQPMSVTQLFRRLIDDVATLFRKELAMATSEVLHSIDDARKGVASLVTGGAVLYAGFIFLLLSATLGLSLVVEGWLAALIVGGASALLGLIMVASARRKLRPASFAPQRTVDSLRKDREMIGRQTP